MSRLQNLAEILRCPVAGVDRVVVRDSWVVRSLRSDLIGDHQIAEKEHCGSGSRVAIVIALNRFAKKALVCAVVLERDVCFGGGISSYADVTSRCGESS